jgi:hypothetical protein
MGFCLPKFESEKFLTALKSGKIQPSKLAEMTSAERRTFFEEIVGENAKEVNALFESKLLLKSQQQGMITWAKSITGIKEQTRRDIISRIEKMDRVLDGPSEKAFLEDLAAKKLGAEVTFEEAKTIADLSQQVRTSRENLTADNRLEYGNARVSLQNYVNDLLVRTNRTTMADIKANPGKSALKGISFTGGLAKSLKASLDNSVIGRQGLKVLFTNPTIWLRNSAQTFVDIARTFSGKDVMNEVKAEVLSRPNALNGLYEKERLAVGVVEEAYPVSLPERVPVVGRLFKASQDAFTAFQYRTRADVFDRYVDIAQRSGAEIQGIGKVANSLTGRGTFGQRVEGAVTELNNVFFSPRFLKSNIDLLTAHALDSGISPFARKQAAMNLVKVIGGVASILAIADAVAPGSVEKDPRSSDFGKIKIGDTRFDVSGGMASIVSLASRLITQSSKSSTSGNVSKLNSGKFGSRDGVDVLTDFFQNKLSPLAAAINDVAIRGRDFEGKKPTVVSTANNLLTPIPITNYMELKNNPNSAPILAAMIADALGIGTNTYSPQ